MKIIFFLIASISVSINGLEISQQLIHHSRALIAQGISQAFLNRFKHGLHATTEAEEFEPRMSLLPDLKDPVILRSLELPLNLNIPTVISSQGHLSMCSPKLSGLSNVTDNFEFDTVGGVYINWALEVPTVSIEALYQLHHVVNSSQFTLDEVTVAGEGAFTGGLDNLFFNIEANGTGIFDKMSLHYLNVDLGFENLRGHAEGTTVNGVPTSLDGLADIVQGVFDIVWSDESKPIINEMIRCSIDHAIRDCNALELINLIVACLDLTPSLECTGGSGGFQLFEQEESMLKDIGFCEPLASTIESTGSTVTGSEITATVGSTSSTATVGSTGSTATVGGTGNTESTVPESTTQVSGSVSGPKGLFLSVVGAIVLIAYFLF